jgi:alginate O-acetyltransferase complex protein AlgI
MTFFSLTFIVFFTIVLAVLSMLKKTKLDAGKQRRASQVVLLGASYIFLGLSDWRFCLLLLLLTIVTYTSTVQIQAMRERGGNAKAFVLIGIIVPLLMLGVFKYFNFFMDTFREVFSISVGSSLNIMLPLGISFFTFTSISYVVDVYRNNYKVSKDFVKVALYIAFFPKIIAGPIIRATEFLPQLDEDRTVSLKNFEAGIQIFVLGLFKKVVLADHLAVFVNDVFAMPYAFGSETVILAAISYSFQIYFDFSGYSDMAIGIAKCMGFDFSRNFNLPYISRNLTEFWKRWHISLSSWLQDYLYISLGGNRKGRGRTYINLILTMLLGGLWHGANWTFILWGGIHGLGLCVHKMYLKLRREKLESNCSIIGTSISVLFTFFFVTICWIFFRADDIQTGWTIITKIFVWSEGINQIYSWSIASAIVLIVATVVTIVRNIKYPEYDKKGNFVINGYYPLLNLNKFWSLVAFFTILGLTIGLAYTGGNPFIYGKF